MLDVAPALSYLFRKGEIFGETNQNDTTVRIPYSYDVHKREA
jgi:hypothetical protein